MVFSSIYFLFMFLPLVLLLYFIAPKSLRNGTLFFFSLIFYAWGEPVYVVLMFVSTLLDYLHAWFIENYRGTKWAKIALISSIVLNIAILGVFKYSDFVIMSINQLLDTAFVQPHLALPIGISFYTFQTMSYTIDVYRGDAKAQKNIIDFGAYIALFPQLIAGPIVRYSDIAEQLNHRRENLDSFSDGIRRFVTGLGKKILLANTIGAVWTEISLLPASEMSVLTAWLGMIAYAFQIYFDFSGYSDMAIGLGKMFDFHFLENFRYPYISKSITEFWRRWHISLGTWFREYVYIPLGGNRSGKAKQLRNILIVWLLTGIWHGAAWNFAVWGIYFACFLIIEKLFLLRWLSRIPAAFSHIYTLLVVLISWVIFAFDNFRQGQIYFSQMFGWHVPAANSRALFLLQGNIVMFLILALAATPFPARLAAYLLEKFQSKSVLTSVSFHLVLVGIFLLSVAYLVDSTYNPFLYFRF